MKKFTTAVAAAAGGMMLVSTLSAAPAMAAQGMSLGSKSCSVGVATSVNASGNQKHTVNTNYMTFPYTSGYVTRNYYPRIKVANSSYVDVSGFISSASLFCDY